MKKLYNSIFAKLALFLSLVISITGLSNKLQAKTDHDRKQILRATKKTTPLVLYHAKDLYNEELKRLAWHYSHSSHWSHTSHYSHYSHSSHYSHYSHYSGW